ncbi:hypothetical protein PVAP13_3NG033790 [Panicum virgatum]|uniref:Uncharacterized protein n=1 Tax=Panicum virgatum TaxID=38727 RepID=A0A8T0U4L5_PANVG|nr:hypothetical protein PVAP13_3NG033790 [Panicum virgatum]
MAEGATYWSHVSERQNTRLLVHSCPHSLSRVSLSLRFLSRLASTAPFLIFWIHAGLEREAKEAPVGLKRGRGIAEPNQEVICMRFRNPAI